MDSLDVEILRVAQRNARRAPAAVRADVAQEAALAALRAADRFDPTRGSREGFLNSVAHYATINQLRRAGAEATHRSSHELLETDPHLLDDRDPLIEIISYEDALERAQRIRAMRAAVARLPEEDRLLIIDLYERGRTQSDIGRQQGRSQQAISKAHARVLQRLRRDLVAA
jgi:RNA polymerase sigma factor (sigma-70 family)